MAAREAKSEVNFADLNFNKFRHHRWRDLKLADSEPDWRFVCPEVGARTTLRFFEGENWFVIDVAEAMTKVKAGQGLQSKADQEVDTSEWRCGGGTQERG